MSLASTGAARGELHIQPSYFTSSLLVHPLREDILHLIDAYNKQFVLQPPEHPFQLFKSVWTSQGWPWLHLKILEPRARQSFVNVAFRLFLEQTNPSEPSMSRVVGLFGLYSFYETQPELEAPQIAGFRHIPIPIDLYESLLDFPETLTTIARLSSARHHVNFVLTKLLVENAFHILPPMTLHSQNPRTLPREIISRPGDASDLASDGVLQIISSTSAPRRKETGRPSKQKKRNKAKSALVSLDKWLENSNYQILESERDTAGNDLSHVNDESEASSQEGGLSITEASHFADGDYSTTHTLLSKRPTSSSQTYRATKTQLFSVLEVTDRTVPEHRLGSTWDATELPSSAVQRASAQVLSRLKHIETMAISRGLQVAEDQRDGLARVEQAFAESTEDGKGLLGMLEGAGLRRPLSSVDHATHA